jgi:hypothetical protein
LVEIVAFSTANATIARERRAVNISGNIPKPAGPSDRPKLRPLPVK